MRKVRQKTKPTVQKRRVVRRRTDSKKQVAPIKERPAVVLETRKPHPGDKIVMPKMNADGSYNDPFKKDIPAPTEREHIICTYHIALAMERCFGTKDWHVAAKKKYDILMGNIDKSSIKRTRQVEKPIAKKNEKESKKPTKRKWTLTPAREAYYARRKAAKKKKGQIK